MGEYWLEEKDGKAYLTNGTDGGLCLAFMDQGDTEEIRDRLNAGETEFTVGSCSIFRRRR